MLKITNILIIKFFIISVLGASEPRLAILNSVVSNELQLFQIRRNSYACKPYGVITLDKLRLNSAQGSLCKKSVERFYVQNPDAQYFSLNLLKVKQTYHLEFRDDRCVLFAKGEKSLSELLLENGLALLRPNFQDEIYAFLYKKAQNRARVLRRGLWGENIKKECIAELYEK